MSRKRTKLSPQVRMRIHQIARLMAWGKTTEEIATLLGLSPTSIAEYARHPDYKRIEDQVAEKLYGPMDEMIAKRNVHNLLEEAAPDAAEALIGLLLSDDEVTKRQAAAAVLDRAGYGPIQRKAIKQRVELDPATAAIFAAAMKESDVPRVVEVRSAKVPPPPQRDDVPALRPRQPHEAPAQGGEARGGDGDRAGDPERERQLHDEVGDGTRVDGGDGATPDGGGHPPGPADPGAS